jgi:DNA-binding NarL/FixJ family response regulator
MESMSERGGEMAAKMTGETRHDDAQEGRLQSRRLRILVVDDHDVVHWGFRLMLGQLPWVERCIGARNGEEAIAMCRRYEPHVALVDLFLGEESGPEVCERLRAEARAAGAAGFISKDSPASEIAKLVRLVGAGKTVFMDAPNPDLPALTDRESEILAMIAAGSTNREIASALYLSPHTVKEHTSTLYRKLGVRNRAEAVQRSQRLGLRS